MMVQFHGCMLGTEGTAEQMVEEAMDVGNQRPSSCRAVR